MELFGIQRDGEIERIGDNPRAYRAAAMDYYSEMVIRYYSTMVVEMRTKEKMTKLRDEKSTKMSTTEETSDTRETRRAAAIT